ncbi:hypothetical protein SAMN04487771_10541, partial [[Clostridium] aminophilum]
MRTLLTKKAGENRLVLYNLVKVCPFSGDSRLNDTGMEEFVMTEKIRKPYYITTAIAY